jgi:hypothetical protein
MVGYGKEYWEVINSNRKIEVREEKLRQKESMKRAAKKK